MSKLSRGNLKKYAAIVLIAAASLSSAKASDKVTKDNDKNKIEISPTQVSFPKTPKKIPQEITHNMNKMFIKLERHLKNGGNIEDAHKYIGTLKLLMPVNDVSYNKDLNKYMDDLINNNREYFSESLKALKSYNGHIISSVFDKIIETPRQISDLEGNFNLALEYEFGTTKTAIKAKRSIDDNAKIIANLYNELHKAGSFNLPKGQKKQEFMNINEISDNINCGSFENGFDSNLIPEMICTATNENNNADFNVKLALNRTSEFNQKIADILKEKGNNKLSDVFKRRSMKYKSRKNSSKEFSIEEINTFLTAADMNKDNARITVLKVKIPQTTSAAENLVSDKPIILSHQDENGDIKYSIPGYEKKVNRYKKYIRPYLIEFLEASKSSEEIIEKENARLELQASGNYYADIGELNSIQKAYDELDK